MNIFLAYGDKKIDPFNNPYYKIKGYIVDDNKNWAARELKPDEP